MDLFSTISMQAVVAELREPSTFFLDQFFRTVIESQTEEIHFDIDKSKPRITPFVSPLLPGKMVNSKGYTAATFKPAYAKDKRRFNPNTPLKRAIGEKIGGTLTPEQRLQLKLGQEIADQLQMLTRREVVMASEALRTGKVTVSGDGFETVVVDFGRDATLTVTLTGNDRWSITHADSDPQDDIETMGSLMQNLGGGVLTDLVLDPLAWKLMRARLIQRGEFETLFNSLRGSSAQVEFGPGAGQLVRNLGKLGNYGPNIWVYQELYTDDAGNTQKMMPDNTALGVSSAVEGARCYGAIQDEEAGYKSTRWFTKSWLEKDPAIRLLLLQSAPLVVPFRPNATVCYTVI